MRRDLITSLLAVVVLTVVLGIAYPLAITGVAGVLFPYQAQGSLIERNGTVIGSELIGQVFTDDQIDSYIDLKMEENMRTEMTPHPVEYDMYYSC